MAAAAVEVASSSSPWTKQEPSPPESGSAIDSERYALEDDSSAYGPIPATASTGQEDQADKAQAAPASVADDITRQPSAKTYRGCNFLRPFYERELTRALIDHEEDTWERDELSRVSMVEVNPLVGWENTVPWTHVREAKRSKPQPPTDETVGSRRDDRRSKEHAFTDCPAVQLGVDPKSYHYVPNNGRYRAHKLAKKLETPKQSVIKKPSSLQEFKLPPARQQLQKEIQRELRKEFEIFLKFEQEKTALLNEKTALLKGKESPRKLETVEAISDEGEENENFIEPSSERVQSLRDVQSRESMRRELSGGSVRKVEDVVVEEKYQLSRRLPYRGKPLRTPRQHQGKRIKSEPITMAQLVEHHQSRRGVLSSTDLPHAQGNKVGAPVKEFSYRLPKQVDPFSEKFVITSHHHNNSAPQERTTASMIEAKHKELKSKSVPKFDMNPKKKVTPRQTQPAKAVSETTFSVRKILNADTGEEEYPPCSSRDLQDRYSFDVNLIKDSVKHPYVVNISHGQSEHQYSSERDLKKVTHGLDEYYYPNVTDDDDVIESVSYANTKGVASIATTPLDKLAIVNHVKYTNADGEVIDIPKLGNGGFEIHSNEESTSQYSGNQLKRKRTPLDSNAAMIGVSPKVQNAINMKDSSNGRMDSAYEPSVISANFPKRSYSPLDSNVVMVGMSPRLHNALTVKDVPSHTVESPFDNMSNISFSRDEKDIRISKDRGQRKKRGKNVIAESPEDDVMPLVSGKKLDMSVSSQRIIRT